MAGPHDPDELFLRQRLSESPESPQLHAMLGHYLASRGRYREADAKAAEARRLDPTCAEAHFLGSILTCCMASPFRRPGAIKQAIREVRAAIELDPDDARFQSWLAQLLILHPGFQFPGSHAQEALRAADRGLQLDPTNSKCLLLRGRALGRLARHDEAIDALLKARGLTPDDSEVYREIGNYLLSENELEAAESCLREAVRLEPESVENRRVLGTINSVQRLRRGIFTVIACLGLVRKGRGSRSDALRANWPIGVLLGLAMLTGAGLVTRAFGRAELFFWDVALGATTWALLLLHDRLRQKINEILLKIGLVETMMIWICLSCWAIIRPATDPKAHASNVAYAGVPLTAVQVLGVLSSLGMMLFIMGVLHLHRSVRLEERIRILCPGNVADES